MRKSVIERILLHITIFYFGKAFVMLRRKKLYLLRKLLGPSVKKNLFQCVLPLIRTSSNKLKKYSVSKLFWPYHVQLNIHQTELWFRYVSHYLTWNCLLISEDFPQFAMICANLITKLFLFWFSYQCRTILWSQHARTGQNRGKNYKSTNNAMSNNGSAIEIIDRSHRD